MQNVCMYAIIQVFRYASMQLHKMFHMQLCMKVWKYASMHLCKYASMHICQYVHMQVYKYANIVTYFIKLPISCKKLVTFRDYSATRNFFCDASPNRLLLVWKCYRRLIACFWDLLQKTRCLFLGSVTGDSLPLSWICYRRLLSVSRIPLVWQFQLNQLFQSWRGVKTKFSTCVWCSGRLYLSYMKKKYSVTGSL